MIDSLHLETSGVVVFLGLLLQLSIYHDVSIPITELDVDLTIILLIWSFRPLPFTSTPPPTNLAMTALKHLKIAPKEAHTATVIFLHVRDTSRLIRHIT